MPSIVTIRGNSLTSPTLSKNADRVDPIVFAGNSVKVDKISAIFREPLRYRLCQPNVGFWPMADVPRAELDGRLGTGSGHDQIGFKNSTVGI